MSVKRVTAYFMDESELARALPFFRDPEQTESFVYGDVEEDDLAKLKDAGLIVQTEPGEEVEADSSELIEGTFAATTTRPTLHVRGVQVAADDVFISPEVMDLEPFPAPEDYYVLVVNGPLLPEWQQQFEVANIKLLERVSPRGYKAKLTRAQVVAAGQFVFVKSVRWLTPAHSTPRILTAEAPPLSGAKGGPPLAMLIFDVRVHSEAERQKVEDWLRNKHVEIAGASGKKIRIHALENAAVLQDLARLPEVDIIAEYVTPKLFNDAARRLLDLDAGANPGTAFPMDGSGQIIAVADTGIDDTHPDFQGRIVGLFARGRVGRTDDPDGHGTHVAGSVLGDGSASHGQFRGVAPKAQLLFQSLLDSKGELGGLPLVLNDLFSEAYNAGARIHTNSWGAATSSMYTMNSEEVDEFVRLHPDMLIVVAAGNEGVGATPKKAAPGFVDWLSIGSPASCKNAITVGASRSDRKDGGYSKMTWGERWPTRYPDAPIGSQTISGDADGLAAFSSRGPCDDRRIKPDLVAPGTDIISTKSSSAPADHFWATYPAAPGEPVRYAYNGGTSMAAPLVAGCAGLVRQYYVQARKHEPSAALLKATLINSTRWLAGIDAIAPDVGKPNYHQGHGRLSMAAAIPNPGAPNLRLEFVDNWKDLPDQFTRTGERRRYLFTLLPGATELRFCLCYTDAPARGLQNNLSLFVQDLGSSQKWVGNENLPAALTLPDPDNNVKTIQIATPVAGTYLAQVSVSNLLKAPQDFALVMTGEGISSITPI